jgi:hypothetical protein
MAKTRRRHSYRKSKRWNPGCMNPRRGRGRGSRSRHRGGRRRNPSGGQLSDGTVVAVSGNFVTLHSPYGEAYDYDGVDHHTLARVRKAKTFSKASSMLSKHCILRSINPKRGKSRSRRKAHPATRKGRHHASRLRSEWKRRTRHGGRYAHLGAVVRTDRSGRIHAGRKKHVKGVAWTGRKGTVALYSRSTGKLWGTNPRRRRKHHKRRRR